MLCPRIPHALTVGVVKSHEANHICDFACEHLGIYRKGFYEGEAASYLVQWIANCINSVKTNKVKIIEVNT